MDSKKMLLIACRRMEDEISEVINRKGLDIPTVWIEGSNHDKPNLMRTLVQEAIDNAEAGPDAPGTVLLGFGLCGNGTAGISAKNAQLVIPRYDSCLNIILSFEPRTSRGLTEPAVMYFTRGWMQEQAGLFELAETYIEKYGEKKGGKLKSALFDSYRKATIIDNGCYDVALIAEYAKRCAEDLGIELETVPGTNRIYEKLLTGCWDDDFIRVEPGEAIDELEFNIEF